MDAITNQLVDALRKCQRALSEEHDGTDFEAECPECHAYKAATEALAAIDAARGSGEGGN